MKKRIFGYLMLLTAALIWGLAFVAQSVGMDYIGPFTFQFSRSLLAVLVMLPTVWLSDRKKDDGKSFFSRWKDKELLKGGLICGLAMFTANSLQQVGLVYTSPGKSGFITVCGLDQLDYVITDRPLDREWRKLFAENKVKVLDGSNE